MSRPKNQEWCNETLPDWLRPYFSRLQGMSKALPQAIRQYNDTQQNWHIELKSIKHQLLSISGLASFLPRTHWLCVFSFRQKPNKAEIWLTVPNIVQLTNGAYTYQGIHSALTRSLKGGHPWLGSQLLIKDRPVAALNKGNKGTERVVAFSSLPEKIRRLCPDLQEQIDLSKSKIKETKDHRLGISFSYTPQEEAIVYVYQSYCQRAPARTLASLDIREELHHKYDPDHFATYLVKLISRFQREQFQENKRENPDNYDTNETLSQIAYAHIPVNDTWDNP
jgi:hypothetical protein